MQFGQYSQLFNWTQDPLIAPKMIYEYYIYNVTKSLQRFKIRYRITGALNDPTSENAPYEFQLPFKKIRDSTSYLVSTSNNKSSLLSDIMDWSRLDMTLLSKRIMHRVVHDQPLNRLGLTAQIIVRYLYINSNEVL